MYMNIYLYKAQTYYSLVLLLLLRKSPLSMHMLNNQLFKIN